MADQRAIEAAEAAASARVRESFAVQYDLAGLPPTEAAMTLRERKSVGRPRGARNRREEDVARAVVEKLGDPLLVQAAIATMPVDELALALGCSRFEAAQERRLAAQVVIPFLHQRQPLAVDVTNRRVVHLVIGQVDAAAEESVAATVEVVDFQEVSDDPAAPV